MIDTATMVLQTGQFHVRDESYFDGSDKKQVDGKFSVTTSFCDKYARAEKKAGRYFPRIGLPKNRRGNYTNETTSTLEIQASLPKVRWGTSAFEVDGRDLEPFHAKLVDCLAQIHVETTMDDLRNATLRRLDFSKTIKLPDYLGDARQVIKQLSNFNYKPCSDFAVKQYNDISEGMALKFWNSTQGYVVYDKFGEIVANGYTKQEQDLVADIQAGRLKHNGLRFELSLERKPSLEAVLRRHIKTKSKDFTLNDVMASTDTSRDILLEVFDKVYSPSTTAFLTLSQMRENELEQYLMSKNLSLKQHALLYYLVDKTTKFGVGTMWEQMRGRLKGGGYERYKKEVSLILAELPEIQGNVPNLIAYLRSQHEKFEIHRPKC